MPTNRTDTRVQSVTITNGASLSGIVDCDQGYVLVGAEISSPWSAADIILQGTNTKNADGTYGTFNTLRDMNGNALRLAGVVANGFISITGLDRPSWRYLKFLSVTVATTTPTNQGQLVTINAITSTL